VRFEGKNFFCLHFPISSLQFKLDRVTTPNKKTKNCHKSKYKLRNCKQKVTPRPITRFLCRGGYRHVKVVILWFHKVKLGLIYIKSGNMARKSRTIGETRNLQSVFTLNPPLLLDTW